jgi:hypothetical protein
LTHPLVRMHHVAAAALLAAAGLAQSQPQRLEVLPARVSLDSAGDHQRVVVLEHTASGAVIDRSSDAAAIWSESPLLERDGPVLRARSPGEAMLSVTYGNLRTTLPVQVTGTDKPPTSYRNEVIPVLTKGGCNAGSCHGAAAGKNGFGLTLFGYDAKVDHRTLTRDLFGRRIDLAAPERSLLLRKATAEVTHEGGKRIQPDSESLRTLHDWIADGAKDDGETASPLVGIEVFPPQAVLVGQGQPLQILVMANYADGTDRDVTRLALWSSNNEPTLTVDEFGHTRTGNHGEAVVLARFGGHAAICQVLVHADDTPLAWPEEIVAHNFVDEHVHEKLRRARVLPAAVCDDATFVRRIHLDLCGILPTSEASRAFIDDPAEGKRSRLIDELLERDEFAAMQAMTWAEVLQVDEETMGEKGALLLGNWLREAFATQRPIDEVVRDLLLGEGATWSSPAANFHMIARQPHLVAERAAQVLLGVQMQCAQCHNHPFERWTMDDYYGFAAFFGQVGRKRALDPDEYIVWNRGVGDVRNQRDQSIASPRLLGAGLAEIPTGTDRRAVLADWLCAPDNAMFTKNVANRVFAGLMGRGLVDPVDDARVGNPPSHPALLEALAQLLVDSDFNVRPLVRAIANSRTYQQERHPSARAELLAGYVPRRLSAEAMLDAIGSVTLTPTKYPGLPLGTPASSIDAGKAGVGFLDAFGRPDRTGACTCDRSAAPTLGQTLHMINGSTVAEKVAARGSRLSRALAAELPPEAMLEDLFLAAYSRPPRLGETERIQAVLVEAGEDKTAQRAAWEDIYWTVLNSKEFLFQH